MAGDRRDAEGPSAPEPVTTGVHHPTRDALRAAAITAALDLLEQQAPADLPMGLVARRLNVSRPLLYTCFADRDELLVCAYKAFFAELEHEVDEALAAPLDPRERLRLVLATYVRHAQARRRAFWHLLTGDLQFHPAVQQFRTARTRALARRWGGVGDGTIVASMLIASIEAATLALLTEDLEDSSPMETIERLLWDGLNGLQIPEPSRG